MAVTNPLKKVFRRALWGKADSDYVLTHVRFWPDRFELVRIPDRCPVCARPGVEVREVEGVEWVGVVLRGGFKEVRRGVLPAKSVYYCAEHAPDPATEATSLPGFKISPQTENGYLKEIVVSSNNRDWIALIGAASRQADEEFYRAEVEKARVRLEERIRHMPGWTLGPCVKRADNLWHASARPVGSGESGPDATAIERSAVNEVGVLSALANLLERQGRESPKRSQSMNAEQ